MSIYRIPFILAAAACLQKSLTSPTARVSQEKLLRQEGVLERMIMFDGSGFTTITSNKTFAWLAALAETAIILARSRLLPQEWSDKLMAWLIGSSAQPQRIADALPPSVVVGGLLALAGTTFRLAAYRALGRHFTYQLTLKDDHQLVTAFPYNVVRHPSYTGMLATYLGVGLALLAPDGWIQAVVLPVARNPRSWLGATALGSVIVAIMSYKLGTSFVFPRTGTEDRMLQERFGTKWNRWADRVPYKLIPMVW